MVRHIPPTAIVVYVIFSFAMSWFRTWRYGLLLQVTGHNAHASALFLITLVRNLFADLLPARLGTLIYIYLVQNRLGIPFGAASASFAVSFLFDVVTFAFLVAGAAVLVSSDLLSPLALSGLSFCLLSGAVLIYVLLPWGIRLIIRGVTATPWHHRERIKAMIRGLEDTLKDLIHIRKSGIYSRIIALSVAVRIYKYLALYVLFLALIVPLGLQMDGFPPAKVFLGLGASELAASLPVSGIAGFGAYEGAWALVFQLLGYPQKLAVLTGVSHHLFTQVYGYALGAIAFLLLLLPVFNYRGPATIPLKTRASSFWFRFSALFLAVILFGFILFPAMDISAQSGSEKAALQRKDQDITFQNKPEIQGWVTYQRPDGIYKIALDGKTHHKLIGSGSSPRWSPDGSKIAFIQGKKIMLMSADGNTVREVAQATRARTVCFHPDGTAILFSDTNKVKMVQTNTATVQDLLQVKGEIRELDISSDGHHLVFTVKTAFGYFVKTYSLQSEQLKKVSRGCSATISPDGKRVTVNSSNHRQLKIYDYHTLQKTGSIPAPPGNRSDNQFWSNHPDWLTSTSEIDGHDIYIHQISTGKTYQITTSGDCDRGDLFVVQEGK